MFIDTMHEPDTLPATADLCIVGAGPAGLSIAAHFLDRGRTVVVLESGQLGYDAEAQLLNLGWASGPLLDRHPFYLLHSRMRLYGGSQNAWGGWTTPLLDLDLSHRDWVPHSGWPLSMADLRPYLARAGAMCGLQPAAVHPPPEQRVLDGAIAARRYVFAAREQTVGHFYRQRLAAADNISIGLGATVTGLEQDQAGRRVAKVHARMADGGTRTFSASKVVLAAGGCENARLLLSNGIGNDCVGRFFMEHPHVVVGSVSLAKRSQFESYLEHREPALGRTALLAFGLPASTQRDRGLLNASIQLWPTGPGEGDVLDALLILRAEQAPNAESRLSLAEERDGLDCPVARLDWKLTAVDWDSVRATAEIIGGALQSHTDAEVDLAGIRGPPWPDIPGNSEHYTAWGCHHIGTTRMSDDPHNGVVDRNACVHGMTNLFIAGSSVFPTSGYANPTVPLIALALRLAEYLEKSM